MQEQPRILVLMATYNAQTYLHDQLKSIFAQQDVDLTLRVVDAGSTDNTYRILETFAGQYDQMQLVYNDEPAERQSMLADLLYETPIEDYDYIALSGQADVWRPNRLSAGTIHLTANTSRPELYYANVRNIDARGRTLGYGHPDYHVCADHPLSLLLAPNWALGCTMLMNGALVKQLRAHPIHSFGRSFDTWVHAVALFCGGFVYGDLDHHYVARRVLPDMKLTEDKLDKDGVSARGHFAKILLREFGDEMPEDAAAVVEDVANYVESFSARRRLSRNKDLCLATPQDTRRMRKDVRRGRY